MRIWHGIAVGSAVMVALATALPAKALVVAMPSGPARVAMAQAIVVGRVVALEDKDVQVQNLTYRIAVVQVNDAVFGVKEKTVRVGFQVVGAQNPNPNIPRIGGGIRSPQIQLGQEGMFFLTKNQQGKFYQLPGFGTFVPAGNPEFAKEVENVRKVVRVRENPLAALKAESAEDRLLGATTLINTYRNRPAGVANPKEEPIPAEESKLILKTLAEAEWKQQVGRPIHSGMTHPYSLFMSLGVTAKDGWKQPTKVTNAEKDLYLPAHTWLKNNMDSYRIKRFESNEK